MTAMAQLVVNCYAKNRNPDIYIQPLHSLKQKLVKYFFTPLHCLFKVV
jgi:hypothetical protein